MKHITIIGIFFLFCTNLNAQYENNNWMFGHTYNGSKRTKVIDFRANPLSISIIPLAENYNLYETNATLSSPTGELEFYTNGINIYNAAHEVVENGGLLPKDGDLFHEVFRQSQGAILLPMPGHADSVVLIHADIGSTSDFDTIYTSGSLFISYSIIDKNANNGKGKVVRRLEPMVQDTLVGGMVSVCRHANGRDWWLLTCEDNKNSWYTILLTPDGYERFPKQTFSSTQYTDYGQSAYSPDGNWFGRYNEVGRHAGSYFDLYRFDRCSGELSDHHHLVLADIPKPGGVAFSPNSRFVYVSSWDSIFQYDLHAIDIEESRQVVAVYDGFETNIFPNSPYVYIAPTRFYMLALAPDGKIYVSVPNINHIYLHTIESPDSLGLACNVQQHSFAFETTYGYGLPNFPHYQLGALKGSPCDTLNLVSVATPSASAAFQLFPNPTTGEVKITSQALFGTHDSETIRCTVYDIMGRLVLTKEFTKKLGFINPDLSALPKGTYQVNVQDAHWSKTFSVIKH